jgi:hypothetical protein
MAPRSRLSLAVAVFAIILLSPSESSAKGIILITCGETVKYFGTVSQQFKIQLWDTSSVGYRYNYVGVFWLDFWTYDGTYCVYGRESYTPITQQKAAELLGKNESELPIPFLYHVPLGWLIFGPLIVIGIIISITKKKENAGATGDTGMSLPFEDVRYQQALALVHEKNAARPSPTVPAATDKKEGENASAEEKIDEHFVAAMEGIDHLAAAGVPRDEARRNLLMMWVLTRKNLPSGGGEEGAGHS